MEFSLLDLSEKAQYNDIVKRNGTSAKIAEQDRKTRHTFLHIDLS